MQQKKLLGSLVKLAQKQAKATAFVFDLDSTLFCTKWRTEKILLDSLSHVPKEKCSKEIMERIKQIEIAPTDWDLEGIFIKHGLDLREPCLKEVQKYWDKYFFRNEYLQADRPYPGAPDFLNKLKQAGGSIFYLSARSDKHMREGSLSSLKKWKFPLEDSTHLILKEELDPADSFYKTKELEKLSKQYSSICFFENEPVILDSVSKQLPQIRIFWMNSAHSGVMSEPPKQAEVLDMSYEIEI